MKKNLGLIFGGHSAEHEVSIVTFFQAWRWPDKDKYHLYPIYLDYNNQAYLAPQPSNVPPRQFIKRTLRRGFRIDFIKGGIEINYGLYRRQINLETVILLTHGGSGEDGRLQGLLDFYRLPYTGSGVLGSALGMDKVIAKDIFSYLGLAVAPYCWFWDYQFKQGKADFKKIISQKVGYPLFVKPANVGSSVGVSRVEKASQLVLALEKASLYDHKILVEKAIEGAIDINCAVMGGFEPEVSVCEQPITEAGFYSFEEKYLKGGKAKGMAGATRIIPAPLPEETTKAIRVVTSAIFKELGGWAMARMDFLFQPATGKIYPNEINTIPGSLAVYLWQASGLEPKAMIDKMVVLAKKRQVQEDQLSHQFISSILDQK
jgi:D-alanine-D-alanine ligase